MLDNPNKSEKIGTMKKLTFVFLAVVSGLTAQDITLSKDSYLVLPASNYIADIGVWDTVAIVNSGAETVTLDSATVELENLDTTRYMGDPPYIRIHELLDEGGRRFIYGFIQMICVRWWR